MADPLSIIGTIITAGTIAASVTKEVLSLVDAFKTAPTAILSLHRELTVLSGTLNELEGTFARKLEAQVELKDVVVLNLLTTLGDCGSSLRRLEGLLLRKFSVEQNTTNKGFRLLIGIKPETLKRARWVFEKDEVLNIRQELGRLTETLNLHLAVAIAYV